MNTQHILILSFAFIALTACTKKNEQVENWNNKRSELTLHNKQKVNIPQGLAGTLTLKEGDCMPMVIDENHKNPNPCMEYPVKRKIKLYPALSETDVKRDNENYIVSVNAQAITTIEADAEGFFQLAIGNGKYSLLVEEKGRLFANSSEHNIVEFVEVGGDSVSNVYLDINYAVY